MGSLQNNLDSNNNKLIEIQQKINELKNSGGEVDHSMEDSLITRTTSIYSNDRVAKIGNYAFYYCNSLTSVNFPVCETIGANAFLGCSNLLSISFPMCRYINTSAFTGCYNLTSINLPECLSISAYAFKNCNKLETVTLQKCNTISSWAFNSCSNLKTITLLSPSMVTLASSTVFTGCSNFSIFVPSNLINTYKNDYQGWRYFSNSIFGI